MKIYNIGNITVYSNGELVVDEEETVIKYDFNEEEAGMSLYEKGIFVRDFECDEIPNSLLELQNKADGIMSNGGYSRLEDMPSALAKLVEVELDEDEE